MTFKTLCKLLGKFYHTRFEKKWKSLLSSIGTWVIFLVWKFISWIVNGAETLKDILKHYLLQTNVVECVKSKNYPVGRSKFLTMHTQRIFKKILEKCLSWVEGRIPEHTPQNYYIVIVFEWMNWIFFKQNLG